MKRYDGDAYWDWNELEAWCRSLQRAAPAWVEVLEVGTSREGRPMLLVVIGDRSGEPLDQPAFWLDGGTHCAEWTGVMACVHTLSNWIGALLGGDPVTQARFRRSTAFVMPCISPDGYHAMHTGSPFIRSTLRPPRDGRPRIGLDPSDVDGDGQILWMRWKDPAGPWIFDAENPIRMRHRTLDDAPEDAWMVCEEGSFLGWDGVRWTQAAAPNGLDLNRNFPAHWAPFEMFGMDAGTYSLSEPESLAVVQAFAARARIGCGLTNHTYTGCLLTQPYRDPSPLGDGDIRRMERLAEGAVEGTGYSVKRVVPDFTYDAKKAIVGVWADAMSTTFGVPGYTLELWDPYGHNGLTVENPATFFRKPDLEQVGAMLDGFYAKDPSCVVPWRPFAHPQLGDIEIGGLDYLHTVRNPPLTHLPAEVAKGHRIADRLLRSLPEVHASIRVHEHGTVRKVQVVLENRGYLGTSSLTHAESIGTAPPIVVRLEGAVPIEGDVEQQLGWLAGWGELQDGPAAQPVYPGLPLDRSTQVVGTWVVDGTGPLTIHWDAGRGGRGIVRT